MKRLIALCGSLVFIAGCTGSVTDTEASTNYGVSGNIYDLIMSNKSQMPMMGQQGQQEQQQNQMTKGQKNVVEVEVEESEKLIYKATVDVENMFSNRDSRTEYDAETATYIALSNESVTISTEGTYILSGNLENAQIIIDADKDVDKIQLVLDNVNINCNYSAPIYVKSADKVFVTMAENSVNTLTVNGEYAEDLDNNVDGAIFSKCDISFNGLGELNIVDNYGSGVVGKDDVVFANGTYNITAVEHGIDANDSVRLQNATLNITSTQDGIHVDDEDVDKGFFYMEDGVLNINSVQDAISTSGTLQIDGGVLELTTNGGFAGVLNTITVGEGKGNTVHATELLENSMKAIKGGNITINGGNFNISSYEDAIHSNSDLTINGGTMYILTGDDGVHADDLLTINDVELTIESAYEGLEGSSITINGGNIFASVLDDAINSSSSSGILTINGGTIHLEATGDGVDSNGAFTMTGGYLILDIKSVYSGGDGNIDVDGEVIHTGGTIVDINGTEIDPTAPMMGGRGSRDTQNQMMMDPMQNQMMMDPMQNQMMMDPMQNQMMMDPMQNQMMMDPMQNQMQMQGRR